MFLRDDAMTSRFKKTITTVLLIGLFIISLACEAKTNTKGKFHLVYLVSAEKLEVGSKVYVEPIIFSNGKKIIPLYDYCRAIQGGWIQARKEIQKKVYGQWKHYKKILTQYGSSEINTIKSFCQNNSFKIPAQNYTIIDNIGQRIKIGIVQFTGDTKTMESTGGLGAPPIMTLIGTSIIKKAEHIKTNLLLGHSFSSIRPHYFVMSSNQELVKTIVPTKVPTKKEIKFLVKRARDLAMQNLGKKIRHCPKGECKTRWYPETKEWPYIKYEGGVELSSPLIADIDNDGTVDLAIYMRSSKPRSRKGYLGKNYWIALGYVFGKDFAVVEYSSYGEEKRWESPVLKQFPLYDPVASLKVGDCSYLLTPMIDIGSGYIGFELFSLPKETERCHDQVFFKVIPVY